MEPVAADARRRQNRPRERQPRATSGSVRWNAVSKQATCGTSGPARRRASMPAMLGRQVQRRERRRAARSVGEHVGVDAAPARSWSGPPCTMRCPTASTCRPTPRSTAATASQRGVERRRSPPTRSDVTAPVAGADLEDARTSATTTRVEAQHDVGRPSPGPRPSPRSRAGPRSARDVGVVAGEHLVGSASLESSLPSTAPARSPQRLEHEVVAAHLVEHDHVERRGRRALLAEAAHVEALGVGLAVEELVHRAGRSRGTRTRRRCPRVKSSTNVPSVMPCGWSSAREAAP